MDLAKNEETVRVFQEAVARKEASKAQEDQQATAQDPGGAAAGGGGGSGTPGKPPVAKRLMTIDALGRTPIMIAEEMKEMDRRDQEKKAKQQEELRQRQEEVALKEAYYREKYQKKKQLLSINYRSR